MIGVFGGNGYLGQQITSAFQAHDLSFVLLEEASTDSDLAFINVIIDCGFPRKIHKKLVRTNYKRQFLKRTDQIQKIPYIYLGSFSSAEDSLSHYGQVKHFSEKLVIERGGMVLKLGLIISAEKPGGRYLELANIVKFFPLSLIPHSDYFPIRTTKLNDFLDYILILVHNIDQEFVNAIKIVQNESTTLGDLLTHQINRNQLPVILPRATTKLLCRTIQILPLGPMNNLKSIAHQCEL
jgi:hypothetical protein